MVINGEILISENDGILVWLKYYHKIIFDSKTSTQPRFTKSFIWNGKVGSTFFPWQIAMTPIKVLRKVPFPWLPQHPFILFHVSSLFLEPISIFLQKNQNKTSLSIARDKCTPFSEILTANIKSCPQNFVKIKLRELHCSYHTF